MSISYHPLEDDDIQPIRPTQSDSKVNEMFCPPKPLLPSWPFWIGLCQIGVGFLCAIFGSLEVFLVPFLIDIDLDWKLDKSNSYGAALWSGVLLILAGSSAVRASKYRQLHHVIQFYILTVVSFLCNLSLLILILWSFQNSLPSEKESKYSTLSLLSAVWCLFGCFLLNLTFTRYFIPVMCEDVKLTQRLAVCCFPCCFTGVSSCSSQQSVNSTESNLIV